MAGVTLGPGKGSKLESSHGATSWSHPGGSFWKRKGRCFEGFLLPPGCSEGPVWKWYVEKDLACPGFKEKRLI